MTMGLYDGYVSVHEEFPTIAVYSAAVRSEAKRSGVSVPAVEIALFYSKNYDPKTAADAYVSRRILEDAARAREESRL
jgi:hypothetical protein